MSVLNNMCKAFGDQMKNERDYYNGKDGKRPKETIEYEKQLKEDFKTLSNEVSKKLFGVRLF